jgi:hypothetical protein
MNTVKCSHLHNVLVFTRVLSGSRKELDSGCISSSFAVLFDLHLLSSTWIVIQLRLTAVLRQVTCITGSHSAAYDQFLIPEPISYSIVVQKVIRRPIRTTSRIADYASNVATEDTHSSLPTASNNLRTGHAALRHS